MKSLAQLGITSISLETTGQLVPVAADNHVLNTVSFTRTDAAGVETSGGARRFA